MEKEERLAEKLKKGSAAALEKIIDGYSGYVCAVIRNFSRESLSENDIDELCSDVFFALWQHREGLDPKSGLRPYLSAAARNAVKNRFRRSKAQMLSDNDISEFEIADDFETAEQAELNELMSFLEDGLLELSQRDREIFMLFYFYGEKASEIAVKTNLSESSVRSVLSRARARLREYLTKRGCDYV
ncbi:MAG: sigma-70 family RNA polymerase sigma factor [Ruminococcaceae bacterium]|nr:sigma-70 family RNA polymerase sigma factor [Oscillospiraceae bacterium]